MSNRLLRGFSGRFLLLSAYFFVTRVAIRTFVAKKVMAYYHVYTKGLEDCEMFRDREDFITGMNLLAVVCCTVDVRLLAFVLMNNHVHFVVKGSYREVEKFISLYKNLLSRYLGRRYGLVKFLHRLETSISVVEDGGDALKRLIAYVLNNPVKAGINCTPQGYEWSSARCYFNQCDSTADTCAVGELGVVFARNIFHTNKKLPADWRVNSSGYVTPESYVDVKAVEMCYGRSRSFEYFLSASLTSKRSLAENIVFKDEILRSALKELLEKKYDVGSVADLDEFMTKHLLRDLRVRFTASHKQLARVLGLKLDEVMRYLE